MSQALHQRLEAEVPKRLAELLAVPQSRVKVQRQPAPGRGQPGGVDLLVAVGDFNFVVECKAKGEASAVAMAVRSVKEFTGRLKKKTIPLVAVSYMGDVGKRLCEEAQVCWLDLSGNAHLVAPGLRVNIEGKPNQFKRLGRPRSVFAPKSARIARWLLVEPDRARQYENLTKACRNHCIACGWSGSISKQRTIRALLGANTLRGRPGCLNWFGLPSMFTRNPGATRCALPDKSSQQTSASSHSRFPTSPM